VARWLAKEYPAIEATSNKGELYFTYYQGSFNGPVFP
jgi:hypothetical protein